MIAKVDARKPRIGRGESGASSSRLRRTSASKPSGPSSCAIRWEWPCDAISWPAETIARTTSGSCSAIQPSTKKVALRPARSSRRSAVSTPTMARRGSRSHSRSGKAARRLTAWKYSSTSIDIAFMGGRTFARRASARKRGVGRRKELRQEAVEPAARAVEAVAPERRREAQQRRRRVVARHARGQREPLLAPPRLGLVAADAVPRPDQEALAALRDDQLLEGPRRAGDRALPRALLLDRPALAAVADLRRVGRLVGRAG